MPDYAPTWKWDDHGDVIEGKFTGLRWTKSKFDDGHVAVMVLATGNGEYSLFMPNGLMRRMSDEAPKYGDSIRIERGGLVDFQTKSGESRQYRAWDVGVVRKEGEYADLSGPGLPEATEQEAAADDDIPF